MAHRSICSLKSLFLPWKERQVMKVLFNMFTWDYYCRKSFLRPEAFYQKSIWSWFSCWFIFYLPILECLLKTFKKFIDIIYGVCKTRPRILSIVKYYTSLLFWYLRYPPVLILVVIKVELTPNQPIAKDSQSTFTCTASDIKQKQKTQL